MSEEEQPKIYDMKTLIHHYRDELNGTIETKKKEILDMTADYNELRQIPNPTKNEVLRATSKAWEMLTIAEEIERIKNNTISGLKTMEEMLYPENDE